MKDVFVTNIESQTSTSGAPLQLHPGGENMADISPETLARLTRLAGAKRTRKCRALPQFRSGPDDQPHREKCECKGTGILSEYVFGPEVRVPCDHIEECSECNLGQILDCECPCPTCAVRRGEPAAWSCCQNRGFNPSLDFLVWLLATQRVSNSGNIGWDNVVIPRWFARIALGPDPFSGDDVYSEGEDPWDAFTLALEEAVGKLVGL